MNAEARSILGRFFLSLIGVCCVLCVRVLCMCVFVQEEKESCGFCIFGSIFTLASFFGF